jgi:phage terminase Nu1 subunit (DNA packaging protein)
MKAKTKADGIGNATELADLLGISSMEVTKLGATLAHATTRGRYRLQASVKNYCENIRRAATGRESDAVMQRRRMLKAQGDLAETRAAIESGTLLDAAAVEARWSGVCRLVCAQAMAVPSRVAAQLPHLSRGDIRDIDDIIRAALTVAGTYDDLDSHEPDDED